MKIIISDISSIRHLRGFKQDENIPVEKNFKNLVISRLKLLPQRDNIRVYVDILSIKIAIAISNLLTMRTVK